MYFSSFSDINSDLKKQNTYKNSQRLNPSYNLIKSTNNDYFTNNSMMIQRNNNNYKKYFYNDSNHNKNNKNTYNEYENIITSKIGLYNLGNTCYMNTCLQNLIHCKFFIKKLVKINQRQKISKFTPITLEFFSLCHTLSNPDEVIGNPSNFKKIFSSKHSEYRGYSQLDTQEFCRVLLEDMNYELNEIKFKSKYKELITEGKSKKQCDKEFDELFRSRENSIIIDTFYAQIINIFTCECGYETYSFQKILDLPLLLPGDDVPVSVNKLLEDYFEGDEINFTEKCKKCGKKRKHQKEIKISQPSNVLILSFQRINERNNKKNLSEISFSEKLNMKKYVDSDCGFYNESQYDLFGIICHKGRINFGHYYAFIKIEDRDWYEFNDSKVTYIGKEINTRSTSVYALFYQKRA